MYHARYIVFAAILSIAGCSGELDPNASIVEVSGTPDWQLVLTIETALDSSSSSSSSNSSSSSSSSSSSGSLKTSLTAALLDVSGPVPVATTLRLDDGDLLQASDGVQTIDLEPLEGEERIYEGTFPMEVASQDLVISLRRTTPPADVDWWVPTNDSPEPDFGEFFIDAPNTLVRLAQPFDITAPTYDPTPTPPDDGWEEFPLGTDVTLTWAPNNSGEDMILVYTSVCSSSVSSIEVVEIENDPGIYTDEVDDFLTGQSDEAKQDEDGCLIRLTLERETDDADNLTPDPALSDDSNLVTRHRRFIEIKSVPGP